MSQPRPSRRRGATPEDILTVAKRHTLAHGWRASRVQEIAAEVGVSRPTLYNAFPSKRDLGIAIVRDENAKFVAALSGALDGARSLRDGIRRGVIFALTEVDRNPLLAMILREEGGDGSLAATVSVGQDTIIPLAVQLTIDVLQANRPDLEHDQLVFLADTAVRLTFSHVLVPSELSHEALAARIAGLCMSIIEAPTGWFDVRS